MYSFVALIWAWWSDAMQLRWPPILLAGVSGIAETRRERQTLNTILVDMALNHMYRASGYASVHPYRQASDRLVLRCYFL